MKKVLFISLFLLVIMFLGVGKVNAQTISLSDLVAKLKTSNLGNHA